MCWLKVLLRYQLFRHNVMMVGEQLLGSTSACSSINASWPCHSPQTLQLVLPQQGDTCTDGTGRDRTALYTQVHTLSMQQWSCMECHGCQIYMHKQRDNCLQSCTMQTTRTFVWHCRYCTYVNVCTYVHVDKWQERCTHTCVDMLANDVRKCVLLFLFLILN